MRIRIRNPSASFDSLSLACLAPASLAVMRPDLSFSRTILTFSMPPIYSSEEIRKNQNKMSINGSSEFYIKKTVLRIRDVYPGS
jgi:hypothetical protein